MMFALSLFIANDFLFQVVDRLERIETNIIAMRDKVTILVDKLTGGQFDPAAIYNNVIIHVVIALLLTGFKIWPLLAKCGIDPPVGLADTGVVGTARERRAAAAVAAAARGEHGQEMTAIDIGDGEGTDERK